MFHKMANSITNFQNLVGFWANAISNFGMRKPQNGYTYMQYEWAVGCGLETGLDAEIGAMQSVWTMQALNALINKRHYILSVTTSRVAWKFWLLIANQTNRKDIFNGPKCTFSLSCVRMLTNRDCVFAENAKYNAVCRWKGQCVLGAL